MSEQLAGPSESPAQSPPHVERDAYCRDCGYNLRSLSVSGNCPECGLPVALSARSDLLSDSNPQWLRRLIQGLWLIVAASTVDQLLYWGLVTSAFTSSTWFNAFSWISLATFIVGALGFWRLTCPESVSDAGDRRMDARRWLRVLIVISIGLFVIIRMVLWASSGIVLAGALSLTSSAIFRFLLTLAQFTYLLVIARRTENHIAIRMARLLQIALPTLTGLESTLSIESIWSVYGGGSNSFLVITLRSLIGWPLSLTSEALLVCAIILEIRLAVLIQRAYWTASARWTGISSRLQ